MDHRRAILLLSPLLLASIAGCPPKVINMMPATLSHETWQDSEPFLAVHPTNHDVMVASAFTPNPAGLGSTTAPVFVSTDGGKTWTLQNIVPSELMTGDITHSFDGAGGEFYAGILRRPGTLLLSELVTSNLTTVMTEQGARTWQDQPFMQATSAGGNDRVYVGVNDLSLWPGQTATLDVSLNGGATFDSIRLEPRSVGTANQNGPSVRPAIHADRTVYVAYFGWRSRAGSILTSDVVVCRDDNGGAGTNPFEDLTDPSDGLPGRLIATSVSIPFINASALGQERIGSTLSCAVDPRDSAIVYVAWADRVGNGDTYTIHVRRSTDRGVTWSGDLATFRNATNAALAIADNGTVGLLYQQLQGNRWLTRLTQTKNAFATNRTATLARVPADTPARQFLPYIGDYTHLVAVGTEFRGVFSANNTPDTANFPRGVTYQRDADFNTKTLEDGSGVAVAVSIDPFFFSTRAIR